MGVPMQTMPPAPATPVIAPYNAQGHVHAARPVEAPSLIGAPGHHVAVPVDAPNLIGAPGYPHVHEAPANGTTHGFAQQAAAVRIDAPAPVRPVHADEGIQTVEQLLLSYERGNKAAALTRLELSSITQKQIETRIRGLGLSRDKTAQMEKITQELLRRLERGTPAAELEAMKIGLERLCCSWGLRASLLANCKNYGLLARLVAVAVTMEQ